MLLSSALIYVGLYVFLLQGEVITACKRDSCYDILNDCQPTAENGIYKITKLDYKGLPQYVYCDMKSERCGVKGGWTRVIQTETMKTLPWNNLSSSSADFSNLPSCF